MNIQRLLNERSQKDLEPFVSKDYFLDIDGVIKKIKDDKMSKNKIISLITSIRDKARKSTDETDLVRLSKGDDAFYVKAGDLILVTDKLSKELKNGDYDHITPLWKVFENDIKKHYIKKSSVTDKDEWLSRDERGFRFDGSLEDMVSGLVNNTSFLDYLLQSSRDVVDFFKSDMKIGTKVKKIKTKKGIIEKKYSYIEVKRTDGDKYPLGQVLSIRNGDTWVKFRNLLATELHKKYGKEIKEESKDKVAKFYFEKSYNEFLKASSKLKNAIISKAYSHFSKMDGTCYLTFGTSKENKKTVPIKRDFVKLTLESGGIWKPSSKIDISIPRINLVAEIIKKYDGPVVENILDDFLKEITTSANVQGIPSRLILNPINNLFREKKGKKKRNKKCSS